MFRIPRHPLLGKQNQPERVSQVSVPSTINKCITTGQRSSDCSSEEMLEYILERGHKSVAYGTSIAFEIPLFFLLGIKSSVGSHWAMLWLNRYESRGAVHNR